MEEKAKGMHGKKAEERRTNELVNNTSPQKSQAPTLGAHRPARFQAQTATVGIPEE